MVTYARYRSSSPCQNSVGITEIHEKTQDALVGLDSAVLAAAVALYLGKAARSSTRVKYSIKNKNNKTDKPVVGFLTGDCRQEIACHWCLQKMMEEGSECQFLSSSFPDFESTDL